MTHTTNLGASSPLPKGGKSLRIPLERASTASTGTPPTDLNLTLSGRLSRLQDLFESEAESSSRQQRTQSAP